MANVNLAGFTPERLRALKKAYAQAVKDGSETFSLDFVSGPLLTSFAKYLIEYLETLYGRKGKI